jgi:hypothetical protein
MKNEKIFIRYRSELRRLIRCVEQSGQQQLDKNPKAVRPPFGTLIKVLKLHLKRDHKKHLGSDLRKLSRLACLTPNVHTLYLDSANGAYLLSDTQPSQCIYDWEVELSCKWPKLRNLTLADYRTEAKFIQHINTEIMLQRLHTLDILLHPDFIFILPPIMSHLQSLKIRIETEESLQRLMTLLEHCGRSLHTLVIRTDNIYNRHLDATNFNLDEMMEQTPNLKTFGFYYKSALPLRINSLPSQLEELEVCAINDDLFSETAHGRRLRPDGRAIKVLFERELENIGSEKFRLPSLKKFFLTFNVFDYYMLKILIANKDTLEELQFGGKLIFLEIAMLMLQEKHARMEKVVNFSILDDFFTSAWLLEIKALFPCVEVITTYRCYDEPADTNIAKAIGIWFFTLPNLKQVHIVDYEGTEVYQKNIFVSKMELSLFEHC